MKIGYARVSTLEQNLELQLQALKKAGCRRIFQEKISAGTRNRPEFQRMLDQIRAGDAIVVWKLVAWRRSTRDLLETMETIQQAGGKFQSLSEPWADNARRKIDHDHFCRDCRICGARGYAKRCHRGRGVACTLATRRSA